LAAPLRELRSVSKEKHLGAAAILAPQLDNRVGWFGVLEPIPVDRDPDRGSAKHLSP